jgi:hypothetical protein
MLLVGYINKFATISPGQIFLNRTMFQCTSALLGSIFIHSILFLLVNFHGFLTTIGTKTNPDENAALHVQLISKNPVLDIPIHSFSVAHKAAIEPHPSAAELAHAKSEVLNKPAETPASFSLGISKYFYSDELTEKPFIVQDVAPVLSLGLEGAKSQILLTRLLINELGYIDQVLFENSQVEEDIKELLQAAFKEARFEPGRINSTPVKSQIMIEVDLKEILFE